MERTEKQKIGFGQLAIARSDFEDRDVPQEKPNGLSKEALRLIPDRSLNRRDYYKLGRGERLIPSAQKSRMFFGMNAGMLRGGRLNKQIAEYALCTGEAKASPVKEGASGSCPEQVEGLARGAPLMMQNWFCAIFVKELGRLERRSG